MAYRAGCKLYDEKTGKSFNYQNKAVEHVELLLPKDAPGWAVEIQKLMLEDRGKGVQALCNIVESAEKRIDSQVWREFEFALHRELTKEQNMALARAFVQDQICGLGMAAQLNFHFDVDKETGDEDQEKPHCHVLMTTRRLEGQGIMLGMNPGTNSEMHSERHPRMSPKKEEAWNKKEVLLNLRVQWQEYSNFYFKLYGHDVQIDHRSNEDRGIEMEPQPKMGRGVQELEKRLQKLARNRTLEKDEGRPPITDKAKAFHDCKLRNLYRILRHPDVVLDIVTKHHATFMWADVQKVLHRYVDELPLFQRVESKLKTSKELICLKADPEGQSIYTTRSQLKTEKSLVEHAEVLGDTKSHRVKKEAIHQALVKADEELKQCGGLSQDQKKAIYHLCDEGQLKCVVGIAGAGKTTALSVCQEIWQESGYAVYGLAPTGKAAQNLEGGGISSMTLHKFLKEFEEGRCQYNPNSILVLDEAGMVDMERFSQLLGAVQKLGVKLIVVGDGAQLQPVEAGPAFRLVTTRLGKSELNTVLRQKEDWQKQVTILFGKQETQCAIQKYADKGHVHIVEERLISLIEALEKEDKESIVRLYEVSSRTSALMYREMIRDINKVQSQAHLDAPSDAPPDVRSYVSIKQHQDFDRYLGWKKLQKSSAEEILKEGEAYYPFLEAQSIDPTKMALLFVDKKLNKESQGQAATEILKNSGLESLVGIEKQLGLRPGLRLGLRAGLRADLNAGLRPALKPRQSLEVRTHAKAALIQAWHEKFLENPDKSSLILAFSNRDVIDLNHSARALLKASGHISGEEFTYTISKRIEDDFEREYVLKEDKNFAKGDRIVFTHNTNSLGVKNGTMGTITDLDKQTVKVKLDGGQEISFAPNLNPYFDQGWAITIHKSQGTTVDHSYVLASYEMTQNLAYVAMTRHRENVQVFGSTLDFWRPEKLPEVLAKSGEKLSPGDYLDADSLNKLMQQDDRLLTKLFERVSNELEAMGAFSKKVFWQVADHFLGIQRDKEIRINPDLSKEAVREEARAEEFLQAKGKDKTKDGAKAKDATKEKGNNNNNNKNNNKNSNEDNNENRDRDRAKFKDKDKDKDKAKTRNEGGAKIRNEESTQNSAFQRTLLSREEKNPTRQRTKPFYDASLVEFALRQNMASFADDIFSSMGEPYHPTSSSATERRYGTKGHIAVNLKTGAWINYKNNDMSGGPLHMLTKLKGLSFKEALDYGANWAGLSGPEFEQAKLPKGQKEQALIKKTLVSASPHTEQIERGEERQAKIKKANNLWAKGQNIQDTLAERYLREHRKIEGPLPDDLRYLPSFRDIVSKQSFPCLMVAVRSSEGDMTAVQLTFLNPTTGAKANIEVPKKSFGVIKGSSVTIQKGSLHETTLGENKNSNILIIAEGIETALSLKSAGIQGTIKASLGLSNIKHMIPESPNTCGDNTCVANPCVASTRAVNTRVINTHVSDPHAINTHVINTRVADTLVVICADHDAPDSPAAKSLERSVTALKERGLSVTVIKPDKLNEDFNDALKSQGPQGIREIFKRNLSEDPLFKDRLLKGQLLGEDLFKGSPLDKPALGEKGLEEKVGADKSAESSIKLSSQKVKTDPIPLDEGHLKAKPALTTGKVVFEELKSQCIQKLYAFLGEKRLDLTQERMVRAEQQAEKAAHFIFHTHTIKGTRPTDKQVENFLLRAKYELNRIPEIRQELAHKWQQANSYKGEMDELIAHVIAERQASIEGRLYLEAKQRGLTPSSHIPDLAAKELNAHRLETKTLAQELISRQSLSEAAAQSCATDILRYQETDGVKPSSEQKAAMVQISRDLNKQDYPASMGQATIEYIRRRGADAQFREWAASNKDLSGFKNFPHAIQDYGYTQTQSKSYGQEKQTHRQEEKSKAYEVDLSL